jgi:hypothetical protein
LSGDQERIEELIDEDHGFNFQRPAFYTLNFEPGTLNGERLEKGDLAQRRKVGWDREKSNGIS